MVRGAFKDVTLKCKMNDSGKGGRQVLKVLLNINRLLEEKGQNCPKFLADFVTISWGRFTKSQLGIPANVTNFQSR